MGLQSLGCSDFSCFVSYQTVSQVIGVIQDEVLGLIFGRFWQLLWSTAVELKRGCEQAAGAFLVSGNRKEELIFHRGFKSC